MYMYVRVYVSTRNYTYVNRCTYVHICTDVHVCKYVHVCNSCNIGISDLPNMYAQTSRAAGPRAESIHIRQITSAYVTTNM